MISFQRLYIVFLLVVLSGSITTCKSEAGHSVQASTTKAVRVKGKWRIAWDVRLGTVRGILDLKQSANELTGTFEEYGKTYPLAGVIEGQAIRFTVSFSGPRPYTIEFRGKVDGAKMIGDSGLNGGARGFLGHAGEVDEPERPWTATRGLKNPNNAPGKPPEDDDDDDKRHH